MESLIHVNKDHLYSNSFYMILNNNLYSNEHKMHKNFKPITCDSFYRIRCYGFTGKNNPTVDHKSIALFFTGTIYNFQEIVDQCMPDILQYGSIPRDQVPSKEEYETISNNITLEFEEDLEDYEDDFESEENDSKSLVDANIFQHPYELIIYLYMNYGMEYTLQILEGEFAFILIDDNLQQPETSLYVARDRLGIQPLYILSENSKPINSSIRPKTIREITSDTNSENKIFGFSTELSILSDDVYNSETDLFSIMAFPPGTYSKYTMSFKVMSSWHLNKEFVKYFTYSNTQFIIEKSRFLVKTQLTGVIKAIQTKLLSAVAKKLTMGNYKKTHRIACLLSGGVDSSIIAALASEIFRKTNLNNQTVSGREPGWDLQEGPKIRKIEPPLVIETFSIGFENSDDIRYARMVANAIGSIHHEVIITEKEYMDTIPIVIQILETYDTATVRAGVAQYLLCKYIRDNSECKHILTGDGADELMGGYIYMHAAPNMIEFDCEIRSLLQNYHHNYGRLRNIYKYFGLTNHAPFLDQSFVNYYLSLPLEFRYTYWYRNFFTNFSDIVSNPNMSEKYLLRLAYSKEHYMNRDYTTIFPEEVLWRPKEDFFDGIRNYSYSVRLMIFQQLKGYTSESMKKNDKLDEKKSHETTQLFRMTEEQQYYQDIFEYFYNSEYIVNHFWRLKYVEPTTEPSAHSLDFYFDYNPEYQDRTL
jgi:asparagine synthase (glutamine-hydrolysing)